MFRNHKLYTDVVAHNRNIFYKLVYTNTHTVHKYRQAHTYAVNIVTRDFLERKNHELTIILRSYSYTSTHHMLLLHGLSISLSLGVLIHFS